jgi:RNA polymerase sigma-70 factor (ECF subfamily)
MLIAKEICDQLSDLEIVQKCLVDVDYLSCMYNRYEAKLLRYINRISSISEDEAEDILQESFIKIWRNLNSYDPSVKLSSWLYRIVHNETISQWRKKTASGKIAFIEIPEQLYEEMQDDFMMPNLSDENSSLIQKILEEMPLKYKEVLVLKFFEKLNYEEISDVLKIPEGTVGTRLNRAKKTFLKIFKSHNFQLVK